MEIRKRLYPYPVLSPFTDDFQIGSFNVTIDCLEEGYDLNVKFQAELDCNALTECIKKGLAKYTYHLECAQTGYRKVLQTAEPFTKYTIPNSSINGSLQICPFIVATNNIVSYSSPDFHRDYQGLSFDIEAGCVLATGKTVTVKITKNIDDFSNSPSIFRIVRNTDESCRQMLVDMAGDNWLFIKMPSSEFYSYQALLSSPAAQPILNSLTLVPVLVAVLGNLQKMTVEEREERAGALWYSSLSKSLLNKFGCDISDESFNSVDCIKLAQQLVDSPIPDTFKFLTSNLDSCEGEE